MASAATVADDGLQDRIYDMIKEVRSTFRSGHTRPLSWRRSQLQAVIRLVEENRAPLEAALAKDLGVNKFWVHHIDLGLPVSEAKYALAHMASWVKPTSVPTPLLVMPASSQVTPDPRGVILIIAPWNYPVSLVLNPLVAAIAAGNAVVIKPSEVSEHTSALLASLIPKYMDTDAIKVVEGAVPETQALLDHHWDLVFYTGSTAVGRIVSQAAAKHLSPVVLELGGKCPLIVAEDADITKTAKRIIWGKWTLNHGQSCISPDYVLVHPSKKTELVAALKKHLAEFFGDAKASVDISRMINRRHCERVANLLEDDDTMEILAGGVVDLDDNYIEPTLLAATSKSKCMKDEIFGPVLPILECDSVDDAIAFINARPKPLALYVFTETKATWKRVMHMTTSGSFVVNDVGIQNGNMHLPFGGVGASGSGSYHGKWGFDAMTHQKACLIKYGSDPPLRFPPFTPGKLKWLGRASRCVGDADTNTLKRIAGAALVVAIGVVLAWFANKSMQG